MSRPSNLINRPGLAIYPALRDAKAALRWIMAHADSFNINPDYLTVSGGSAGAITSIGISTTNLEDYRDEISLSEDPTLASTHMDQAFEVRTIIDFWGSDLGVGAIEEIFGLKRFDEQDPPIMIVHGTADPTVTFDNAEELRDTYDSLGIPFAYYPLQGLGHGPWSATVNGKALDELAFDFIIDQQELIVE